MTRGRLQLRIGEIDDGHYDTSHTYDVLFWLKFGIEITKKRCYY